MRNAIVMRSHSLGCVAVTLRLSARTTFIGESKHNLMRSCRMNVNVHVNASLRGWDFFLIYSVAVVRINITSGKWCSMMSR